MANTSSRRLINDRYLLSGKKLFRRHLGNINRVRALSVFVHIRLNFTHLPSKRTNLTRGGQFNNNSILIRVIRHIHNLRQTINFKDSNIRRIVRLLLNNLSYTTILIARRASRTSVRFLSHMLRQNSGYAVSRLPDNTRNRRVTRTLVGGSFQERTQIQTKGRHNVQILTVGRHLANLLVLP